MSAHPPTPRAVVLASGSAGNALLLEAGATRLLVDAGLSAEAIERSLADAGADLVRVAVPRDQDVEALKAIPFERNSNDFHFDTEIIIQLMIAKLPIIEMPIPTYYGDEICRVNGMAYAWNCLRVTAGFVLSGRGRQERIFAPSRSTR